MKNDDQPQTLQEAILYFADKDRALKFVIKLRWLARLRRMDNLERNAMMMAIGEFRSSIAGNDGAHVDTAETDDAAATPEMAIATG